MRKIPWAPEHSASAKVSRTSSGLRQDLSLAMDRQAARGLDASRNRSAAVFRCFAERTCMGTGGSNCSEDREQGAKRPDYFRYLQWAQFRIGREPETRVHWIGFCYVRCAGVALSRGARPQ